MKDKPSREQKAHAEELQRQIDELVAGHSGPPSSLREFAEQFDAPPPPVPDKTKKNKKRSSPQTS
jgi:ferritin-like protein